MLQTPKVLVLLAAAAATSMAAVDPVLLNLVMPDAQVIMGVQVAQSQSSPLGQYLLSQAQSNNENFNKFIQATGFDPRRDLKEVVVATASDPTATNKSGVLLGRGTFQSSRLMGAATVAGGVVSTYRGITMINSAQSGSTSKGAASTSGINTMGAMAFLDDSTVAMGDPASVKGVIDRKLGSATFSGALAQKAVDVSNANSVWFVTAGPSKFLSAMNQAGSQGPQGVATLLQAILQISGGVQLGSNTVTLATEAVTRSDQDAQSIVNVLKFLVGMVGQNSDPRVAQGAALAQAAQVTSQGPVVRISLSVPETQLEQWLQIQPTKAKKTAGLLRH